MKKIVCIGTKDFGFRGKRLGRVYCEIEFERGELSITGVEGPLPSGNALGSCGQINVGLTPEQIVKFNKGWDADIMAKFLSVWSEWHLNHMKPGCEHQMGAEWDGKKNITFAKFVYSETESPNYSNPSSKHAVEVKYKTTVAGWTDHENGGILCKPCSVCGYKYGTAWLKKEIPAEVIDFLFSLPDAETTPAWV